MHAIGIQQAIATLPQLVQDTVENCEETIIVSEAGAVVLIEQQEWEHMVETLRLIQDKTSLKALLDGHRQRDAGNVPDGVTMEEAFHDLYAEHSEKRQIAQAISSVLIWCEKCGIHDLREGTRDRYLLIPGTLRMMQSV